MLSVCLVWECSCVLSGFSAPRRPQAWRQCLMPIWGRVRWGSFPQISFVLHCGDAV